MQGCIGFPASKLNRSPNNIITGPLKNTHLGMVFSGRLLISMTICFLERWFSFQLQQNFQKLHGKKNKPIYPHRSLESILGYAVNPGEINFLELLNHPSLCRAPCHLQCFSIWFFPCITSQVYLLLILFLSDLKSCPLLLPAALQIRVLHLAPWTLEAHSHLRILPLMFSLYGMVHLLIFLLSFMSPLKCHCLNDSI